ncbi:MAG: cysteine desulfurase CsdA [Gammaproteobacteria bacterium]|nr:cysteine desulfurase CsdA [Gammaproteobacteria bacterium]OUT92729.1 MAG: aminotransferase [Gammaproteobacteria bacterium TMED36]|tara:strand:+ start:17011 stop:18240 length:1230 start_codon:yes stop_codon:yes gene_type:complete
MKAKQKKAFERIREEFPILDQKINGEDLIYLDNAASTQKPKAVINAIKDYYENDHSNVHRGVHTLSVRATEAYENARVKVTEFLNSPNNHQIIFTKGTTDSINLIATSITSLINENDEILITAMEHHSNIVPWQELCKRTGAVLKIIPINENGEILIDDYKDMVSAKTKLISVVHLSNTLGTINPIEDIIKIAKSHDVITVIDGAQAAGHLPIDVQQLDCDFYLFSGHKIFGPTGIGVLYGKEEILNRIDPYQYGGEMILKVTFEKTTYNSLPHKFEAGTPNIAGAVGIGASIDFINSLDRDLCHEYEMSLHDYALNQLEQIDGIRIIGKSSHKSAIISFVIDGMHPHDIGTIINQKGIAVRTGHHCTMPLMDFYEIPGTVRASFSIYNNHSEIDKLIDAIKLAIKMLK